MHGKRILTSFLIVSLILILVPFPVFAQTTAFTDGFEDQTFGKWDDNGAPTIWAIGTYGSGTGGSADPHTGDYDAWATEFAAGALISDNISLADAGSATYSIWLQGDDLEDADLVVSFWDGDSYNTIFSWLKAGNDDDVWFEISGSITSEYWNDDFSIQIFATTGNNENIWVDDVLITKTVASNEEYFYGDINSQMTIVSGKFVSYSTYCDVAPLLTIGTIVSYNINKYAYANISLSFSMESGRTVEVLKYHSISPQYSLFSTNLWTFDRKGIVYQLTNVDGWIQKLVELGIYGDLQPLIIVDSSLQFAIVKYGDMEIICQVTTSKDSTMNLFLSVSPLFVIVGNYSEEAATIENIYGVIGQILGVDNYVLYVFESSGDINQNIAIATSRTVSLTELMEILQQMGLDNIAFKDLVKSILINQDLTINSLTLNDLMMVGVISEDFTINDYSLKELSNFGLINENVNINSIDFEALARTGLINENFLVDGEYLTFGELLIFGAINLDLTVTDDTLTEFNRLGLIDEHLTSNDLTVKGLIRDGLISENFLVDDLTLKDLVAAGIINLDLTITNELYAELTRIGVIDEAFDINGLTLKDLIEAGIIDENFVLNDVKLLDLIKAGIVNEELLTDYQKAVSFNLFTSVNPSLNIVSTFGYIWGTILNFFGSIAEVLHISTVNDLPLVLTTYLSMNVGLVFFFLIVGISTVLIVYNQKKKNQE